MNELNIEAFGGIIDQLLTENEVNMLITLPKGSLDVQIQENIKLGSVIRFYIFFELHKTDNRRICKRGWNKQKVCRVGWNC